MLRDARTAKAVMFRLEGFASLVICSGALVEALAQRGFTGMKFAPLG
ncbi:MAG: hypothetical protein SFX73_35265 [Kofleriaceae bacterium]|nr:hypothetical protein [Kofleriaceae bacterium]